MEENKPNDPHSAAERGKRLYYIRTELLHLSRNALANRHTDLLSKSALQNWEDGRYGGLTEKGAKKFIQALEKENIECSLQWLLYGVGSPPVELYNHGRFSLDLPNTATTQRPVSTDEEAIEKELRFFKAVYGDTLDAIVRDNGLNPFLGIGDYVAGIRYTGKEINQAINQLCIVQTYEGLLLTRKLQAGSKTDYYTLTCTSPELELSDSVINDVKLFSVAPIAWVRKPLSKRYVKIAAISIE